MHLGVMAVVMLAGDMGRLFAVMMFGKAGGICRGNRRQRDCRKNQEDEFFHIDLP